MFEAVVVVVVALTVLGALRQGWRRLVRHRAVAVAGDAPRLLEEHGVTVRALLYGVPPMMGLDPKRTNRLVGDLVLTEERFVLGSDRGLLADVGDDHGRRFTSARCTGPGRLVLEGELVNPAGEMGLYRFELVVQDAPAWARALQRFVKPGAEPFQGWSAPG